MTVANIDKINDGFKRNVISLIISVISLKIPENCCNQDNVDVDYMAVY